MLAAKTVLTCDCLQTSGLINRAKEKSRLRLPAMVCSKQHPKMCHTEYLETGVAVMPSAAILADLAA